MSFQDVFKNSFLEEFTTITVQSLLTAVILAFLLGVFIVFIYRMTYSGAMFNKSFAFSLVLLSMVTSVVILTISSNVVLSLGMVGALSIVRFRTAVKEPLDTVFMFWAIVVGIMTGAGFALISGIATLVIGVLLLLLFRFGRQFGKGSYLVMLRLAPTADATKLLMDLPAYRIKSRSTTDARQELVLEMKLSDAQMQRMQQMVGTPDVLEVNIVSYHAQTTL